MKPVKFKYYLDEMLDSPQAIFGMMTNTGVSDVSIATVIERGGKLPRFPSYKQWRHEVLSKQRCGRCWRVVRGKNDLMRHNAQAHPMASIYFPKETLMERLDYKINEGGLERWISRDKVLNILGFLFPHTWEEIEQKMSWDRKPIEYVWGGKNCRIEYKGPDPRLSLKQQ